METPQDGRDDGEVIDLMSNDDPKKGEGEGGDAKADAEQRGAADDQRQEPAEPARGEDDGRQDARDDDRDARREDPPRHRYENDEDYSRRVQGRINRERALRLRETRKVDELTIANNEMRNRLARLERAQKSQEISGDATKKLTEINAKIEGVKAKLAAAIEAGDTKLQLDINIELADLVAERKVIEKRSEALALEARQGGQDAGSGADQGTEDADPDKARIAAATRRWQRENRNWWNLRRFSDVQRDAIELDKELRADVAAGQVDMQEYSDEYFAELSARLKELYPDLDVRDLDGQRVEVEDDDLDRDARNRDDDRDLDRGSRRGDDRGRDRDRDRDRGTRRAPPRRHAAGNLGSGDRRRQSTDERSLADQGRVRLSSADYAQMREYGMDPNDPKQKKAFARERMRTILSQGRDDQRGGGR